MLADIMGTAPRLARLVSRRPRLLDAILDPGFLGKLPAPEELTRIVREPRSMSARAMRRRSTGADGRPGAGVSSSASGDVRHDRRAQAGAAYAALAES